MKLLPAPKTESNTRKLALPIASGKGTVYNHEPWNGRRIGEGVGGLMKHESGSSTLSCFAAALRKAKFPGKPPEISRQVGKSA